MGFLIYCGKEGTLDIDTAATKQHMTVYVTSTGWHSSVWEQVHQDLTQNTYTVQ